MNKHALLMAVVMIILGAFMMIGFNVLNREEAEYFEISPQQAKEMMEEAGAVVIDVREQDEYDSGHVPGAVLLPVGSINEETAAEVIPEKDTVALVYCRSGNRSKKASAALAELGYTEIYEFGGIKDWPYDIEK